MYCVQCGNHSLKILPSGEYLCEYCGTRYDTEESREKLLNKPTEAELIDLFYRAAKYEIAHDYMGELKLLVEYKERCWDDVRYLLKLGRAYRTVGFKKDAIECYERAREYTPEDAIISHNLAVIYLSSQEPQKAVSLYEDAIRKMEAHREQYSNDDYAGALANYGGCLIALGNNHLGEDYLKRGEMLGYKNGVALRKMCSEMFKQLKLA